MDIFWNNYPLLDRWEWEEGISRPFFPQQQRTAKEGQQRTTSEAG